MEYSVVIILKNKSMKAAKCCTYLIGCAFIVV